MGPSPLYPKGVVDSDIGAPDIDEEAEGEAEGEEEEDEEVEAEGRALRVSG